MLPRLSLRRFPGGVSTIHMTQGLSQYPAMCKGGDHWCLPCPLLWRPLPCGLWDFPGRNCGEEGGHKGECPTWEGRKQRTWTGGRLGERKFFENLKSLQGDFERVPASSFPFPFPELAQGLEECPGSVGPVLSVIHLSVPTFK